jgi:hypothetical protein
MTSGYHNSLAPFLVHEIQSQYHTYGTNINHSHKCTNEVMFTAVQEALTNKATVEMEWNVPVHSSTRDTDNQTNSGNGVGCSSMHAHIP